MRTKTCLIIISLLLLIPWTSCSNGSDPATPSGTTPDLGIEAPNFTLTNPPRDPSDSPDISVDPEYTIELNPAGGAVVGNFTFGDTPVAGIEVRINDELADFTDGNGDFEVPAILDNEHTISFAILGEVFYSQPYSPVARFAQDDSDPGPGVMAGAVYDEDGPVPGALVIVAKGDSYAYAFSGQYGQYYVAGAPTGSCLAICLAEFHDPAFKAVVIPTDGTPLEQNLYTPKNLTLGRIYGRVISPNIGAVPHAYVQYVAPGVFRADLSNIFGIFELEAIPVGWGTLTAEREYFYPVEFPLHVNPGINPIPVIMHAIEQSTIHGCVVNGIGEPINGAVVRLAIFDDSDEYPVVYGQYSGPGGYFHFEDLLPGAYMLQSFMPGLIPATEVGVVFPGTLIEETLVMYPGVGGHANGWVVDWEGEPIVNSIVQLRYIGTDIAIATLTNEDGYWELNDVPYGACEVHAESAAFLPGTNWCDIYPNDPGETITMCFPPVDLPTGELFGIVNGINGETAPYMLVWIFNIAHPELSFMTITNEVGEYYFPNPIAGTTAGWAMAEGYQADDGYVEIVTGELAELNFELIPE